MSVKVKVNRLPLVLAVALATQAMAAEEVVDSGTVQVWGTEISSDSSLLDEDIELKQADHLSDLLRDQPGVDIGGAHSLNQRVTIRGVQDLDLEITIDGARQNNYMYHHMGNLMINADILKAVDLQVGTNSVISGGLGGGASFETKDAKELLKDGETMGARVSSTFASNSYWANSITGYAQLNDSLDVLAYVNSNNRNNPEDGSGYKSIGNDGTIVNGLVKLGLDVNDANRLEVSYDKYNDEGDYAPRADMGALTNNSISGDTVYPTEFERETVTLGYELDLGDTVVLDATLYRNTSHLARDQGTVYAEGVAVNTGLDVLAESVLDVSDVTHTLRYGVKSFHQETERKEDNVSIRKEDATSYAAFVEDEILFANGFELTPGARYNHYSLNTAGSNATFIDTTLGLEGKYPVSDRVTVRASSTQLFQGPGLSEAFSSSTPTVNPELKPETGVNSEVGLSFEDRQIAGLDRLNASVTLFRTDINDYINDEGDGVLNNVGDYQINGFEARTGLALNDFSASLSYSRSRSRHNETREVISREVGDSIALSLNQAIPSYDLSLNWTSTATLKEKYTGKPAYDVHNVSASWAPKSVEGLSVTAGIENIFDEYYASHASRTGDATHPYFGFLNLNDYEPGRNVKLTVSYIF
ncbi:MAG: TonB-dependent receptor domain-containing protein [Pontibacterium sp.]